MCTAPFLHRHQTISTRVPSHEQTRMGVFADSLESAPPGKMQQERANHLLSELGKVGREDGGSDEVVLSSPHHRGGGGALLAGGAGAGSAEGGGEGRGGEGRGQGQATEEDNLLDHRCCR